MRTTRSLDLSTRPRFPSGLKVLLLESDSRTQAALVSQLQQLDYCVTTCSHTSEAVNLLQNERSQVDPFDVLLADITTLGNPSELEAIALLESVSKTSLVLMGNTCSPDQVLTGINFGAVDFLDKPVSMLKLKNIWQHTVRRMMVGCSISTPKKQEAPQSVFDPASILLDAPCSEELPSKSTHHITHLPHEPMSTDPLLPSTPSASQSGGVCHTACSSEPDTSGTISIKSEADSCTATSPALFVGNSTDAKPGTGLGLPMTGAASCFSLCVG